jgi:hypothetical protein
LHPAGRCGTPHCGGGESGGSAGDGCGMSVASTRSSCACATAPSSDSVRTSRGRWMPPSGRAWVPVGLPPDHAPVTRCTAPFRDSGHRRRRAASPIAIPPVRPSVRHLCHDALSDARGPILAAAHGAHHRSRYQAESALDIRAIPELIYDDCKLSARLSAAKECGLAPRTMPGGRPVHPFAAPPGLRRFHRSPRSRLSPITRAG